MVLHAIHSYAYCSQKINSAAYWRCISGTCATTLCVGRDQRACHESRKKVATTVYDRLPQFDHKDIQVGDCLYAIHGITTALYDENARCAWHVATVDCYRLQQSSTIVCGRNEQNGKRSADSDHGCRRNE